jgi:hypothetical protein
VASAHRLDSESIAATQHLESVVGTASTAQQFHSDFQAWMTTLQGLGKQGDALAVALHVPECRPLQIGPSPQAQAG